MSNRQLRYALALILVLMAVLQIAVARRQCLWADEFFSLAIATGHSLEHPANIAQPDLGDFVEPSKAVAAAQFRRYLEHENPPAGIGRVVRAVLLSDTSPPLYYLLLYDWTLLFGTSDMALRLFSVSWALASLPVIAAIAHRIAGRKAVLITCLLFAFSPIVTYYSTEGRMYSLLIFLTLMLAWVSLILQERGAHFGYCLLWIAVSVAGFLTHYFFVFPWLANVAFLLFQPGKLQRRWLFLCLLITGLAVLPWMWPAAGSLDNWRITRDRLHQKPKGFHRTLVLLRTFWQFFSGQGYGLWRSPLIASLMALALCSLAAGAALWRLGWQCFTEKRLLLWLWLALACAGPTVVDLLQHTYLADIPRYALAALPAACLLVGIAISFLGNGVAVSLLCLIIAAWTPGYGSIYRLRARSIEPYRAAAEIAQQGASDLVLVHSIPSGVLGIARYSTATTPIGSWVGQLGNRHVPASLRDLIAGYEQVSLIKLHQVGELAPEEDWLRSNWHVLQEKRMGAATVVQFKP